MVCLYTESFVFCRNILVDNNSLEGPSNFIDRWIVTSQCGHHGVCQKDIGFSSLSDVLSVVSG
jgi:hypothetical protein